MLNIDLLIFNCLTSNLCFAKYISFASRRERKNKKRRKERLLMDAWPYFRILNSPENMMTCYPWNINKFLRYRTLSTGILECGFPIKGIKPTRFVLLEALGVSTSALRYHGLDQFGSPVGTRYCGDIGFLLDLHRDIDWLLFETEVTSLYDIFFQHYNVVPITYRNVKLQVIVILIFNIVLIWDKDENAINEGKCLVLFQLPYRGKKNRA